MLFVIIDFRKMVGSWIFVFCGLLVVILVRVIFSFVAVFSFSLEVIEGSKFWLFSF